MIYDAQGRPKTNVADLTPTSGSSGWTAQSVPYADAGGRLAEDNADLSFDSANRLLHVADLIVGDVGWSGADFYGLAHEDCANTTDYALIQSGAGATFVNAKTGSGVALRVNNAAVVDVTSTAVTLASAVNIATNTGTGTIIATTTAQKIGFHGAAATIQRVGAAQAAVATTGATNVAPFGFTTAAQADAIVTLVNELRAALVAKGLIKGSA